jgi:hypothetical protein
LTEEAIERSEHIWLSLGDFHINEQRVKDQIEEMVFGFMDDHDLDETTMLRVS